jgi:sugar lactone lactonase YvrE
MSYRLSILLTILFFLNGHVSFAQKEVTQIASFKGQQVTGVTVSQKGRIFVNFPRWRQSVRYSVTEVDPEGGSRPYPGESWNSWQPGQEIRDSLFIAVQSVVAAEGRLYVLDTRNPLWQGVVNPPRIFVFDLQTDELAALFVLSEDAYRPNSYTNDLRVDPENGFLYITDSGEPGLIVFDMNAQKSSRVLDQHFSTTAEFNSLTIQGERWGGNPVHADGIAYHAARDRLYYHALTGYTLYSVSAEALRSGDPAAIEQSVKKEGQTPAPDGMIFDEKGNLYMADLEKTAIYKLDPSGKLILLAKGESVGWADSFSIHEDKLFFTDSKIHLAGEQAEKLDYTLNWIKLD